MTTRVLFFLFFINSCFSVPNLDLSREREIRLAPKLMSSWRTNLKNYLEFISDYKKFDLKLMSESDFMCKMHNYDWLRNYTTIEDVANTFSLTQVISSGEDQGLVKKRFYEIFKQDPDVQFSSFIDFIFDRVFHDFRFILSQLGELEKLVLKDLDLDSLNVFYENKYLVLFRHFNNNRDSLNRFIKDKANFNIVKHELEYFLQRNKIALSKFYPNLSCEDLDKTDYVNQQKNKYLNKILFTEIKNIILPDKLAIMILCLKNKLKYIIDLFAIQKSILYSDEIKKAPSGLCLCIKK